MAGGLTYRTTCLFVCLLSLVTDSRQLEINRIPTIISTPFCGSASQLDRRIIISVLMSVNCVLLILGMAFVILTRELKYKGLNDSVYIGVSVYSLVIFGVFAIWSERDIGTECELVLGLQHPTP